MKKIKKIIYSSIITSLLIGFWFAIDFPYDYNESTTPIWSETEIWQIIQTDVINENESSLNKLLELFNLSQQSRYWSGTSKAIYYAKMIVNMLLSLVSLIALAMLIFAFYLMFFSRHESGMTKAKQMLKGIGIALAIMWLSWFIVSFIFWIQSWSANNTLPTTSWVSTATATYAISITP